MAEQHHAHVDAALEEMRRETVAQRVTTDAEVQAGLGAGLLDGARQRARINVMPSNLSSLGVSA